MRQFLIAGASLFALTTASMAADLPAPAPEPYVAPAFSWSGAYIGAHGGWGSADIGSDYFDDIDFDFGDVEGFVVGGQIGYNFVWDNFLLGIEGDGSFTDLTDDLDDDFDFFDAEGSFLASIRGRLGFAVDRFLVYGTGGVAFAGMNFDDDDPLTDEADTDFTGWVAGGGVEYAITDNLIFGVEFLHYEFDSENFDFDDDPIIDIDADLNVDVIRGRLSYKFGDLFN